jgi:hypothetical protein
LLKIVGPCQFEGIIGLEVDKESFNADSKRFEKNKTGVEQFIKTSFTPITS